jgi:hypothetical protein
LVDDTRRSSWEEFLALPSETFTVDIHCVTQSRHRRGELDGGPWGQDRPSSRSGPSELDYSLEQN